MDKLVRGGKNSHPEVPDEGLGVLAKLLLPWRAASFFVAAFSFDDEHASHVHAALGKTE